MFRKHINTQKKEQKDRIVWRSHEVTRIEAFSDAVFAFALTLLIVSLEVPRSLDDLMYSMIGFVPFGLCFLLVFYVWREQYIFFRRYGLHDSRTISLNGMLIFMVLFFVYPLKFLFTALTQSWMLGLFHIDPQMIHALRIEDKQVPTLMFIYSGGYMGIFILFSLMYYNAWKKRDELKLTDSEVFETRTGLFSHLIMVSFGFTSILLAFIGTNLAVSLSGVIYSFIGIPLIIMHRKRNKIHRIRFEQFGKISKEAK